MLIDLLLDCGIYAGDFRFAFWIAVIPNLIFDAQADQVRWLRGTGCFRRYLCAPDSAGTHLPVADDARLQPRREQDANRRSRLQNGEYRASRKSNALKHRKLAEPMVRILLPPPRSLQTPGFPEAGHALQGATADCNWRRPSGGCPLSTWDLLSRLCYGRETERRGVRSLSEVNRGGVLRHPPPRVRRQR